MASSVKMSELDRLKLENDTLHRILQKFACMPTDADVIDGARVVSLVERSRRMLAEISKRKRPLKEGSVIEAACRRALKVLHEIGEEYKDAQVMFRRRGPDSWEAYAASDLDYLTGHSNSPLGAVKALHERLKLYRDEDWS